MNNFIRFIGLLGCALLAVGGFSHADDESVSKPTSIEPIEFIDAVRPQAADAAARRTTPAVPTGWGYGAFSPDSQTVATVSVADGAENQGEVTLWNVADATQISRFVLPTRIAMVLFSPDGKSLAIGPNGPQAGVTLVDAKTGQISMKLPGPAAKTNVMLWSPDGDDLILGSTTDKSIRVWNVKTKKFVRAYEPAAHKILAIGFDKSGRLLAAGVPDNDRDGLAIFDVVEAKMEKVLKGHKELVEAASFTHDCEYLASAGWDATIRLWNLETGEEAVVLKGHKKGIKSLAITPDGKRIATSGERECKLWDGTKHELLSDLGGENAGAKFVSISPDGAWLLSIARNGTAKLWDVEKQTEKSSLDQPSTSMTDATVEDGANPNRGQAASSDTPEPEAVQSIAYSKDGKWIASAREDGRVSIRNASDGKVARELEAFPDVASCVAFSDDSTRIAAGSFDKSIKVWNIADGELQAEFTGHTNWIFSITFSPDGLTLASGSYDKTIKLWNLTTKKETATLSGHTAGVRSVIFARDGQSLISGSADRTAMIWNLSDQKPVATLKGHAAAVRAVAISPDGGTVATASEDATVKLWNTSDWTERATLSGTEGVMFWCLAFSPAGRTLAAGAFDGTVKLYDPQDGKERQMLRGPTEAITAVAFAPDAHEIVAGSVDKTLRRWKAKVEVTTSASSKPTTVEPEKASDTATQQTITATNVVTLNIEQPVSGLGFSKDGKRLLVGGGAYRVGGSLQLWDVAKREPIWKSDDFKFGVPAVAFSPDESRIAMGTFADNFIRLFDATTGKQLKEVRGHRGKVHSIAWSSDGKWYATASLDRDLKLWDAATNKELKTFTGHSDYVFSVAISPDNKRLLSGSADRTARLWDVETGKELMQFKGHQRAVQQAVFSRDGSLIACASADYTVRIYDAQTGYFLLALRGHRTTVETVAFSPNGKYIVSGSSDKSIRVWDPNSGVELLKLNQDATVRVVLFTADGKQFASAGDDKTVKWWDLAVSGQ